ncbi:hypothetical protein [Mycobacteroides abscessus]|uniref:Uncharacterized protein n=2 Tax=Mycobacteroides abscessus TaxID=36809 RepID=X8DI59_9MYCO|nr:hypothetical protein [Mycobacteroides abscessus]EUA68079.1 hypothetical protein I540_4298 [Mycobacteroides abscessus subsp. bolletii 1513]AMU66966.1 hypothetical protein A3O04_18065 [Mycobacteroides abscessus]AMU76630.1 hypothetical protein A3O06_20270 [Mycobacteroides abscessus]ANO00355.1 hypothetical protein BAB74_17755 [Mycobacteroides abscessus]ANO15499.1 hypothetical protein BAB77_17850 [Mycobacteroides abscessus]
MPFIPTAAELAGALAGLLDDLQPELPSTSVHRARVGANIARILQRELTVPAAPPAKDSSWDELVQSVRAELAIVKPGYDAWEGE